MTIIRCTGIACWIRKATNTHSQYVILVAFPQQPWLHERASILRLYVLARLVVAESECVYYAVRTECLNVIPASISI